MISHPMRLDSAGAVVTMPDGSDRAAAELAGHVISCMAGERPLAPPYGMPDDGINGERVAGVIALCEPEIEVVDVEVTDAGHGRVAVRVSVDWSEA